MKKMDQATETFERIASLLNAKHGSERGQRQFSIEGSSDSSVVAVTVLLKNAVESFYYPVEGKIDLIDFSGDALEAALFLLDYIALYFEEYFREDEGVYLPIDWTPHTCDEYQFFLRGQILNRKMESMADRLLAGAVLH
jgi:hypothetical protein